MGKFRSLVKSINNVDVSSPRAQALRSNLLVAKNSGQDNEDDDNNADPVLIGSSFRPRCEDTIRKFASDNDLVTASPELPDPDDLALTCRLAVFL